MVTKKKLVVALATVAFSFASSQVSAAPYAKRLTTSTDSNPNCAWIWYKAYHTHYSPNRGGGTSDRTYEYHIVTELWHGSASDQGACNFRRYDAEQIVHNAYLRAGPGGSGLYRTNNLVEIMRTVNLRYYNINRKYYVGRHHANAGPAVCSRSIHTMKVKGRWYHKHYRFGSARTAC